MTPYHDNISLVVVWFGYTGSTAEKKGFKIFSGNRFILINYFNINIEIYEL
jgi:hypothetical protein